MDKLVRKIRSEVMAMPWPGDYNLRDNVYQRLVQSTSETLLKQVSSLVSDGFITKQSLTLAFSGTSVVLPEIRPLLDWL